MSRPISTESVFRALAHATRRGIVELLIRRPTAAGELASHFKHARPVFSKHLRILEGAGLVAYQRQGTKLVYRLMPSALASLQQWVGKLPRGSRPTSSA